MDSLGLLSLCLARGSGTTPDLVWSSWSLAPQTVVPLLLALAGYALGARRLHAAGASVPAWRHTAFVAGVAVLAIALVSPLCRLASTLVTAHMVQHVLLVTAAPLLIVLASPLYVMGNVPGLGSLPAVFPASRLVVTALYGLAIWLWHFPPLYAAIVLDAWVHVAAYAALVAVSLAFWSSVVQACRAGRGLSAVPMLFGTLVHTGLLGALLVFSPRPWYPVLAPGAGAWGLTPIEDQQLAGLVMWVPMSLVYLVAALAIVAAVLGRPESRTPANASV